MPAFFSLLAPRYWLWWVVIGIFWCLTCLPYRWQLAIGRQLGRLTYWLAPRRRHIAEVNLKLCFPNYTEQQRHDLLRHHFESLGMGLLEVVNAWWASDASLKLLGQLEGLEYLQNALARGKGVILLSAHFTSSEIASRFLTMHAAVHGAYRPHQNPLLDYLAKKSRESRAEKAIPRDNIRDMLRSLKQNKSVWFAIDQNFGHKHSVFAKFFNVPAATNTATARIAQMSGAAVVPFFVRRLPDYSGYEVILQPALSNFPSDDALKDAELINQLIEQQILKAPEQYLWVHRRFKDRPEGEASVY